MPELTLNNYEDLKSVAAKWLNRRDLTDSIPLFVTLAEALLRREVRRRTIRETITLSEEVTSLPSACAELRSIFPRTSVVRTDQPLQNVTPEMFAEARARRAGVRGKPRYCTVVGSQLLVSPVPDQDYDVEIWYYAKLEPLTATNASNYLLTEAPDVYLHATLLQAEPYLKNDDRVALWSAALTSGIEGLNRVRDGEERSASLRPARLPMTFGATMPRKY